MGSGARELIPPLERPCPGAQHFAGSAVSVRLHVDELESGVPVLAPPLPPRKKKKLANFITTALNGSVLGPSNYSSLRCGRVEKSRKSAEVGVSGLEPSAAFLHPSSSRHPSLLLATPCLPNPLLLLLLFLCLSFLNIFICTCVCVRVCFGDSRQQEHVTLAKLPSVAARRDV